MQEKKEQSLISLPYRNKFIDHKATVYKLQSNAVRINVIKQNFPLHICILKMHTVPQYSRIGCKSQIRNYIEAKLKATFRQFIRPSDNIIITTDRYEVDMKMLKIVFGNVPIELWLQKICSFDLCKQSNCFQSLKFINSIINNILKNNKYSSNNKNTYFFKPFLDTVLIPNIFRIEGFSTSLRYLKNDILLFLKDTKKYINSKTVLEEINEFYYQNRDLQKWQRRMQLNQIFKNQQIMCQYGSNKIYTLQTFVFDANIDSISFYKGKKKIDLKSYYYDKYNLRIEKQNQPLIRVRGWKESFFIPEFMCRILKNNELNDIQEQLDIRLSSQPLEIQLEKTHQILSMLKSKASFPTFFNYSREMNISIQQNLIKLTGIALQYPTIRTGKGQIVDIFQGRSFQFENKIVYQCEKDLNICIICPTSLDINSLKKDIIIATQQIGVNHNIVVYTYGLVDSEQLLETIKQMIFIQKEMKRKCQTNIYWIFFSKHCKNMYESIKKIALDESINEMTQITLLNTLESSQRKKIIQSIIQQMVAKIQGKLWIIENKLKDKNILMIGLCSKLIQYRQTILSFCFNIDPLISQFSSRFYIHHNRCSILQYIKIIVMQAIQLYLNTSKSFPDEIIILRNQHEFNELQQSKEIDEILEGVNSYYLFKQNKPGISYLTVKPIKNLKISLIKSDSFSRPFHGLLISTEIVAKDDFILANEFTSSNSYVYYRKIYKNTTISFDQMAEFLYHQTFNYYNFQGGVSIPAILKYAQKQAIFLSKLQNIPELGQTSNFLYFL